MAPTESDHTIWKLQHSFFFCVLAHQGDLESQIVRKQIGTPNNDWAIME